MSVLSPWYFFHLLWLFPAILLLYFLKLRREEVVVPSVLLWRRAVDDMRVNSPFQRLTRNLLLFLQLLAAALLILAMMRPVLTDAGYTAGLVFLVIDNSGSMNTRDAGDERSRLDAAKEAARAIVLQMARDDRAMIISFNERARALTQVTGERAVLLRALEQLPATDLASDPAPALRLVKGYRFTEENAEVIFLSDGAFSTEHLTAEDHLDGVTFVPLGETSDNLAVLAVNALRSLEGEHELQATATIANFGRSEATSTVSLYIEGTPIGVREVKLPPMEKGRPATVTVVFDDLQGLRGALEVRIDRPDALVEDNHGYLDLRLQLEFDVLLVSPGDPFIENVLRTDGRVSYEVIAPQAYSERYDSPTAVPPSADLVIFDSFSPKYLQHPATLFFGCLPPIAGFSSGEKPVIRPHHLDQSYEHPLTRFVNFAPIDSGIEQALDMEVPERATVLWEAREGPLLALLIENDRRTVVSALGTTDSTWVLEPSWPLFFGNVIDWFGGSAASTGALQHAVGEVVYLKVPEDAQTLEVTLPGGEVRTLVRPTGADSVVFGETERAGFYVIAAEDATAEAPLETELLACNFAAAAESDVTPSLELSLPSAQVVGTAAEKALGNREIWRGVTLALLALLVIEWWYYHHRVGRS